MRDGWTNRLTDQQTYQPTDLLTDQHVTKNGNYHLIPLTAQMEFYSIHFLVAEVFSLSLDTFSHLYTRVCPSVGPSVRPSHTSKIMRNEKLNKIVLRM